MRQRRNEMVDAKGLKKQLGFRKGFKAEMRFIMIALKDHAFMPSEIVSVAVGIEWGRRTDRFNFKAETGMEAMTPAKFVEFVAKIANQITKQGEKSQQAAVNTINAHFRN